MAIKYRERQLLRGSEENIFKLVRRGATPVQWREWLKVPLEHAAVAGDVKLTQLLLDAGADGKAGWTGCRGRTLLSAAAKGGKEAVVWSLLKAGARPDVNATSGKRKWSALHHAAAGGHEGAATVLIMAGADTNCVDVDQRSPLHVASERNHERLVCELLIGGAFPHGRDRFGRTPLHIAAALGHMHIISSMVLEKADVNIADSIGRSPLHLSVTNGHLEATEALLSAGADISLRYGESELSALDIAATFGEADIVQLLIRRGADPNARHPNGTTVLHTAAYNDNARVIDVLVEAGASVEARDTLAGSTPLFGAAQGGSCDAIAALVRHNADVNAPTFFGRQPLHAASRFLKSEAIDLLLRSGADEVGLDGDGRSAREMVANDLSVIVRREKLKDVQNVCELLARTRKERAWNRRGLLVMSRSFPNRVLLMRGNDERADGKIMRYAIESCSNSDRKCKNGHSTARFCNRREGVETMTIYDRQGEKASRSIHELIARVVGMKHDRTFRKIVSFL